MRFRASPSLIQTGLIFPLIFSMGLLMFSTGCGVLKSKTASQNALYSCPLPLDQKQSLILNQKNTEFLVLELDAEFSEAEKIAIRAAVNSWNTVAEIKNLKKIIQISDRSQTAIRSLNEALSCESIKSLGFNKNQVPVYKVKDLNELKDLGYKDSLGITTHCQFQNDRKNSAIALRGMNLLENIEVFENSFQTSITHEIGHLLGMDHSCSLDVNTDDYVGCSMLSFEHPYVQAVMYPSAFMQKPYEDKFISAFEPKLAPKENDQLRLSCVLPELSPSEEPGF